MSTDEPDAEDLAEAFPHVAQLEEQLKEADIDVGDIPQRKGTTRRDLLAGSAGLLGLGGILTGATGGAQAGDDQAGQFGTQAAPLDGYVEDLYDKNGNRVAELPGDGSLDVLQEMSAESVSTERLGNTHVYASAYGGDGAAIQSALNEYGENPSVVHVDVEVPSLSNAPLEVPSNTTVSIESDISLPDSTPENIFQNANFEDDATDDELIGFVFRGGTLDGNKANQTANQVGSGGTHASGFYQCGISFVGAQNVWVENPQTRNCQSHGVNLTAVTDARVVGGKSVDDYYAGVHSHWRETDDTINENITCQGLTVVGGPANGSAGIYISGTHDWTVEDCTVRDSDGRGIGVVEGDNALGNKDGDVINCTISNVGSDLPNDDFKAALLIRASPFSAGDGVQDLDIEGLTIEETDEAALYGVSALAETNPLENIAFRGCEIDSVTSAIRVENSSDAGVSDLTISDCRIDSSDGHGALLYGVNEAQVGDNRIRGAGTGTFDSSGVTLLARNSVTPTDANIVDNYLFGGGEAGVRIEATDSKVAENVCRNNAIGILEESGSSGVIWIDNDVRGNDTAESFNGAGTITDPVNQDTTDDYNIT